LTFAFAAASPADQQAMLSFLPAPHADGSPIQVSEMPVNLPAYLIHVTAELRVDGQTVASGVESFGRTVQRQANVVDLPGLSYGFFFGAVAPVKLYGAVVSHIIFIGGLMDIGHERRIGLRAMATSTIGLRTTGCAASRRAPWSTLFQNFYLRTPRHW
jgi:hypothetical protein